MEDLRRQYGNLPPVDDSDLAENPIDQFKLWIQQATEIESFDWFEPNVMTLATASKSGEVSARIVLLKGVDDDGLIFFTNYDSSKGKQLAENPRAAIVMHWPMLERQVRSEGEVERVSRSYSERYFHSRPRGSQIGAAVSPQSEPIADRQTLEDMAAELERAHANQPIPLPDNWGGFRIKPFRFEFWQGQKNRLHDRFLYEKENGVWGRSRLAP